MNRIKCFFTGGHKYSDENLQVLTDDLHDLATFTNQCIKCGKAYEVQLPYSVVLGSCLADIYNGAHHEDDLYNQKMR